MNLMTLLAQTFPVLGLLAFLMSFKLNRSLGLNALMVSYLIALGISLAGLLIGNSPSLSLAYLLSSLILFVCLNIQYFSWHYMYGDRLYNSYFIKLALIGISANCMVFAANDFIFWFFWTMNNLILISLMIHKSSWKAAKASGILTLITLGGGSLLLGGAFMFMSYQHYPEFSKLLLIIAALCQSAIWPFNRWLMSSLNSPTPVSALMHAGIVNGGGILLVKYYPWFLNDGLSLNLIFALGLISAIIAGFCKLIQADIKKMLANSTMAQMGFMMMQIGLGLYPAAIAHLCWHGLFKAYLFLNAGSALKAKFQQDSVLIKPLDYFWIIMATLFAVVIFSLSASLNLTGWNTQWFLIAMVAITSFQLSKGLVGKNHIILDLFMVGACAAIYGFSIHLIELCFASPIELLPLNGIHLISGVCLLVLWGVLNSSLMKKIKHTKFWQSLYIRALNFSQPQDNTITAIRGEYKFK